VKVFRRLSIYWLSLFLEVVLHSAWLGKRRSALEKDLNNMATLIYPFPQITASGPLPSLPGTAAGWTGLTPRNLVAEIHISPAAGNTETMHVYDVSTGIVLKDLLTPANGNTPSFDHTSGGGDQDGIDPAHFGIALSPSDKANVYAVIR
jgi:hypothetical protein